jgi:hypothetical protein
VTLPTDYTNATVSANVHPAAHNDVNARVNALATVEAWQTPTLIAPYTNYGAPFHPVSYYKDPFGVVHLRGLLSTNGAAANTTILVLPVGYRPSATEFQLSLYDSGAIQINLSADGAVVRSTHHGPYVPGWFGLDGVSFRVAP